MSPRRDLEVRFNWISVAVVALFSSAFAVGLILYVMEPGGRWATAALRAGLLLLIASPAARIGIAAAERVRRRDWPFAAMLLVIALELVLVLWRAS